MKKHSLLPVILWCGMAPGPLAAQDTVLQGVDLIDGTGRPPQHNVSIVIGGGRIRNIGPAARIKPPAGANVVDLAGKTVMPGIINLHGHVGMTKGLTQGKENYTRDNIEAHLRTYASYGVTSVVSMGSDADPELMIRIRDEQRGGRLNGARVYSAGRGFTIPGGYPAVLPGNKGVPFEVSTAAQARAYVDELAKMRVDLVKMWVDDHYGRYQKLPPELYTAIIDQAHKRKLKTAAHLFYLNDAKGLLDAGLDALAHSVRDRDVDEELIAKIKKNNAIAIPTLSREQSTFVYAVSPPWLDDPFFLRVVQPETVATVKSAAYRNRIFSDPDFAKNKAAFETASRNLKKLRDAGVRLGFGTYTGPPARFQGFFEHWEMELMADAGLTPIEVIQAASKNAAEFLGVSRDFGTLEKGKYADLIVLGKNPLDDIRNTRTIHSVYIGGQKFQ
ncbi:MAG: amidohydrolase family protein [Acidobacteria bacterium]|nr:amidohydrolase family protein [Acidobacteriota bacterium]